MTTSLTSETKSSRILQAVFFITAMTSISLHNSFALAAVVAPNSVRVLGEVGRIEDTTLIAGTFTVRPPRRFGISRLEATLGGLTTSEESRSFISFGPVWGTPITGDAFYFEFGISPTLLGGSSINGSDIGGNFHFTSSASIGRTFGVTGTFTLALRVQHTSNGGLSSDNPGIDMVGLNLSMNIWN
ncbi:MAG: acyloxyacyl hydrolase [Woeseiaceae bacterium]